MPVIMAHAYKKRKGAEILPGEIVVLGRGGVFRASIKTKIILGVALEVCGDLVWVCDGQNQIYEISING